MSLFVYVTERCRQDASKYSLTGDLDRFRDRVEATQSTSSFDQFPPPFLVKKKFGSRQSRLIATRTEVGEHGVIVLHAILIRGDREYEDEFMRDPHAFHAKHFAHLTQPEQIASFVEERTRSAPPPPKPGPSAFEYGVLYEAFSHHESSGGDLICETPEWVEQITQERLANHLVRFCQPCLDALDRPAGLHFLPLRDKEGWGVWALRKPDRLFLLAPSTDTTAQAAREIAQRLSVRLEGADATDMLRASRRVYPALILADEELWIDLEKEPVANMALSPEESEVLESARRSDAPFPLFINGRAGSGKSTILQYLFADLLYYYLNTAGGDRAVPPIYLTANPELLRIARGFVTRLLKTEASFSHRGPVALQIDGRDVLEESFREFQPYLLSLVPLADRAIFPAVKRIDYARFRQLWMARLGRESRALRDYGPDLSWHVIRSYIKGMSSETFLEPDDYSQLPQNQLTVTRAAFKQVFDRVWGSWYEGLRGEGFWDDQDLTRYLLDSDLVEPVHPAVFCDEAQDFTRLELELLLRLSLFSNRTLPPQEISRVPFAFAGDQFQTLNPTGFRWDAIKASFVEKFIFELDPARRSGRTDLNYRELQYNYRSTHRIVRFSNHVQALRAALFHLPDLRPQAPWTTQPQSFPVTWFRSRDAKFWEKFRANSGMVLIVPCNEGEEADFVRGDSFLRENVRMEEGVPLNVLSAARAKGCEYPSVVVYGFGQAAAFDRANLLASGLPPDVDQSLPLQYFINRLYVAVSRAKRRLVIVDTDDGFQRLWHNAIEEAGEAELLNAIKNGPAVWGQYVEGMTVGNPDDLTRESAGDPLENAKAFEADGLARRDDFLLRQAAQAYRSAGNEPKARECRARALEFAGNLLGAGEAFFDAGFVREGLSCFWQAGPEGWAELAEKLSRAPEIAGEIEFQLARAVTQGAQSREVIELLRNLTRRLEAPDVAARCVGDAVWRDAVEQLLRRVLGSNGAAVPADDLSALLKCVEQLHEKGITVSTNLRADLLLLVGRTEEAVAAWDATTGPKPPAYHHARAAIEPYPQRILSLSKLKLPAEIVHAYVAAPHVSLDGEQSLAVIHALEELDRIDEAADVAWKYCRSDAMQQLALLAWRNGSAPMGAALLEATVALLVREANWEILSKLAGSGAFLPTQEWRDGAIQDWARAHLDALRAMLVRALARSKEFSGAPTKLQRQLSDFLRAYLLVRGGNWRNRVTVGEAGAAIERGGRFTEAIVFYEEIAKEKNNEARTFARQRWLLNKKRQLEHERAQNAKARVTSIERDIAKAEEAWEMEAGRPLPEFPELPPLLRPGAAEPSVVSTQSEVSGPVIAAPPSAPVSSARDDSSPAGPVTVLLGSVRVDVSRETARCNLTHIKTMETAFVKVREAHCGGEVDCQRLDDKRWVFPSWGLSLQLPSDAGEPLLLELREAGLQLSIAMS